MRKFLKGLLCATIFASAASFADMWCTHVPDPAPEAVRLIENEIKRPGEPTGWRLVPFGICFGTATLCSVIIYTPEIADASGRIANRIFRRRRLHG